jgi:flagellar assembly factor FliW
MGDFLEDIVYSENDIIKFPNGIPGFNNIKEFVIIQTPEFAPFEWLVCTDTSTKLRFAVINPMLFRPDYSPNIGKEQIEDLEINKPEDILLYAIVTIKKDPAESTANLLGPVIINKTKRIGKQIIIEDTKYTTKEKIIRKK